MPGPSSPFVVFLSRDAPSSSAFIYFFTNRMTLHTSPRRCWKSSRSGRVNKIIEIASGHIRKYHNLGWMIQYWYRTRGPLDRERTPGLLLFLTPPHISTIWSDHSKIILHTMAFYTKAIKNRLVSRARAPIASESTPSLLVHATKLDSHFTTMIVLLRCNASFLCIFIVLLFTERLLNPNWM